jgi:hypothetical protein
MVRFVHTKTARPVGCVLAVYRAAKIRGNRMDGVLWLSWPLWQQALALGTVSFLFGGMTLFAFGFAAFVFSALEPEAARSVIRRAFPPFYLWVIVTSALAAALLWPLDKGSVGLMAAVALTTVPTRQVLMPAINAASDAGNRKTFQWLHGGSVLITLVHIGASAVVLVRFIV